MQQTHEQQDQQEQNEILSQRRQRQRRRRSSFSLWCFKSRSVQTRHTCASSSSYDSCDVARNHLIFFTLSLILLQLMNTSDFVFVVTGQEQVPGDESSTIEAVIKGAATEAEEEETVSKVLENVAGLQDELSHSNHKDDMVVGSTTGSSSTIGTATTISNPQKEQSNLSNIKIDNVQLPMGDVNILFMTDINGWIASHRHDVASEYHYHQEDDNIYLDADLGDFLSFYQHVKYHCDSYNEDLFFILGGNIHSDHTAFPYDSILSITRQMPFDVITLGPSDIESIDKIQMLTNNQEGENTDGSSFTDYWSYKLVNSNLLRSTEVVPSGGENNQHRRDLNEEDESNKFIYGYDGEENKNNNNNNNSRARNNENTSNAAIAYFDDTSRFFILNGEHTGQRILTFSFMESSSLTTTTGPDSTSSTDTNHLPNVENINNILQTDWFRERIFAGCPNSIDTDLIINNTHNINDEGTTIPTRNDEEQEGQPQQQQHNDAWYDAVLILGHFTSNQGEIILHHIHKICPLVPVQFLTGKTGGSNNNSRGVVSFENEEEERNTSSVMIQGGKNLDTFTFVSFPVFSSLNNDDVSGEGSLSLNVEQQSTQFQHEFIDGNIEKLRSVLNIDDESISYERFKTLDGKAISDQIQQISNNLGLNQVLGCTPQQFYSTSQNNVSRDSLLFPLYTQQIIPQQLLRPLLVQATDIFVLPDRNSGLEDQDPSLSVEQASEGSSASAADIAGIFVQRITAIDSMFENDLLEGVVTVNDIFNVIPHEESILELTMLIVRESSSSNSNNDNIDVEEEKEEEELNDDTDNDGSHELFSYHVIQQLLVYMNAVESRKHPNNAEDDTTGKMHDTNLFVVKQAAASYDISEDNNEDDASSSSSFTDDTEGNEDSYRWILYCTESDIDTISNGLNSILQRDNQDNSKKGNVILSIQTVLMIPPRPSSSKKHSKESLSSPKTIEIDEETTNDDSSDETVLKVNTNATSTASIVALAQEEMGGAPLVPVPQDETDESMKEPQLQPVLVTTRSLLISYISQNNEWNKCREEMLREETIEEVTKVASYTIAVLILASICSSCISCSSLLVFLSIWCQQAFCTKWKKQQIIATSRQHGTSKKVKRSTATAKKKKKRRKKKQTTKQHELTIASGSIGGGNATVFESVHYDSDVSSVASDASSVASERSFV